jgi:ABC-type transport system substrate-binding protein
MRLIILVAIVVVLVLAGFGYEFVGHTSNINSTGLPTSSVSRTSVSQPTNSTSSFASTVSSSTSAIIKTSIPTPSTFTYETSNTIFSLDPASDAQEYSDGIIQNVYEPLLWYDGTSSNLVIPWLAQNYSLTANGRTANFTLRSGITFADGEPLNSSAVYFTLNRDLMYDGSEPSSHGIGTAKFIQGLGNRSLSTYWSKVKQPYGTKWAGEVLGENFIQITGPLTFTMNLQNPSSAFANLLSIADASILAPDYVMAHDLALWNQSSTGYKLPYPSLSGNLTTMMGQYFDDLANTCNAGITPSGCATSYLYFSDNGSLAGTGPYILKSASSVTNDVMLQANPSYWGEPYQFSGGEKILPRIQTIEINFVISEQTRILDLQSAASTGRAMTVDITADQAYSVVDRNLWLKNHTLISIIPGVTIYPPAPYFAAYFGEFYTNVTNPITGNRYSFQPFADLRFRLAFGDSVNFSLINQDENNGFGQVANEVTPPGLPPAGSHNSSIQPAYSYNLTEVQDLLLSAMRNPINHFTFYNGSVAPVNVYNNSFGCVTLDSKGQCADPVLQTITLEAIAGDQVNTAIEEQIAAVVNNISSTYNMGLTVAVVTLPASAMIAGAIAHILFFYTDFHQALYPSTAEYSASLQFLTGLGNWNISALRNIFNQLSSADAANNLTELIAANNAFNEIMMQQTYFLWTYYPDQPWAGSALAAITSNVQGYYFNPSISGIYFASLF